MAIAILAFATACAGSAVNDRVQTDDIGPALVRARTHLAARDIVEMRKSLDDLAGPDGAGAPEAMEVSEVRNKLRATLIVEIEARVSRAHSISLAQAGRADAMREWQVASYYLGLLPDAASADEARKYQGFLTEHESTRDRILKAAQLRYSISAVEKMKAFAVDYDNATAGLDDTDAIITAGATHFGGIDVSQLTPEAQALYQSLLSAALQSLNEQDEAHMVDLIEAVPKEPMP